MGTVDSKIRKRALCQFTGLLSHNTQLYLPFRSNGCPILTLFFTRPMVLFGAGRIYFFDSNFEGEGLRFLGGGIKINKWKKVIWVWCQKREKSKITISKSVMICWKIGSKFHQFNYNLHPKRVESTHFLPSLLSWLYRIYLISK